MDTDLVEGKRGEFTVWVNNTTVAQKTMFGGFPSEEDVVAAVREALKTG